MLPRTNVKKDNTMVLFLNCCVRKDSRTKKLADAVLDKMTGEIEEIKVFEIDYPVVNEEFLRKRDSLIANAKWDDPIFYLARQFSKADSIVIAAPYWDLSFPAALKQYFEQINVLGITFEYSAEGTPIPLCAAKELIYITTAGGAFVPEEYGFGYVKALAQGFYGIKNVRQIKAIGLDIYGADADQIIEDTLKHI